MRTKKIFLNMLCDILPYLLIGIVGIIKMDVLITYVKTGNTFFVNSSLDKANVTKVNNALESLPIPNNMPVVKPDKSIVYGCLESSNWVRV